MQNNCGLKRPLRDASTSGAAEATTATATYRMIIRLAHELRTQKKVTDRRNAGTKLLSMLVDAKVRSKLHREARYMRGSPTEALSALWKIVIMNALYAAEASLQGGGGTKKQKVQPDELMLPYKLLRRSEDAIHTTVEGASTNNIAAGEPDMPQPLEGSHVVVSAGVLSEKEILELLNFCLKMLNDDQALENSELDLLEMLNHLCSRPEYVVHFRLHSEVNHILAEIKKYFSTTKKQKKCAKNTDLIICAAKALSNLMSQTCTRLGLGMHSFLAPCVKLVADFLRPEFEGESQLIYHLFTAVTHLLASHLSHSIVVMEEHGETLLHYARQCFPSLPLGVPRDAIIDYFSVHLSVCEEAGRLQGLSLGELGRVGSASLDDIQLNYLLSLIASEKALAKLPSSVTSKVKQQQQHQRKHNIGKYNDNPHFLPLSRRHRRYLELCARLLRYTQSAAVLSAKLELVEDVTTLLVGTAVDEEPSILFPIAVVESHSSKVTSFLSNIDIPSLCVTCPWAQIVIKNIKVSQNLLGAAITPEESQQQSQGKCSEKSPRLSSGGSGHSQHEYRSFRNEKDSSASIDVASSSTTITIGLTLVIPCLQCICACAEAFPLGECWSTNVGCIRRHQNAPFKYYGGNETQAILGKSCSTLDLAAVVSLVTSVLVSHGSVWGDPGVQVWVLLALIKLSESSLLVQSFADSSKAVGAKALSDAWQVAWSNLLRQDLRYMTFTRDSKTDSAGELVLRLLQNMVANFCTSAPRHSTATPKSDSSSPECVLWSEPCRFLRSNQHQLWCLPIFEDPSYVKSGAVFELIITFQTIVGITEEGQDKIDRRFPSSVSSFDIDTTKISHSQTERRFRLVCFCLRFIEESISISCEQVNKAMLALASACLSSLLCDSSSLPTFKKVERNSLERFSCTADEYEFTFAHSEEQPEDASPSIVTLWGCCLDFDGNGHSFDDNEHIWRNLQGCGPRLSSSHSSNARRFAETIRSLQKASGTSSLSSRQQMLEFSLRCLRTLLSTVSSHSESMEEEEEEEEEFDFNFNTIVRSRFQSRAFGVLALISTSVSFVSGKTGTGVLNREDEALLLDFLDDYIGSIPFLSVDHGVFNEVSACILGIIRMLSLFSEYTHFYTPMALKGSIGMLFDACQELLNGYGMRFGTLDSKPVSLSLYHRSKLSKDDFTDSSGKESDSSEHELRTPANKTPHDFSSSDSDTQHANLRTKKKAKHGSPGTPRLTANYINPNVLKTMNVHANASLDSKGFRVIANILAILEPSSRCCRIVADSLLGLSSQAAKAHEAIAADLDPRDVIFVCQLFCNDNAILRSIRNKALHLNEPKTYHSIKDADKSIVAICSQLIMASRSHARPSSIYDLFGFRWGSKIVSAWSCEEHESELDGEVNFMLDLLNPAGSHAVPHADSKWARKSINSHPRVRASQLSAVTEAFLRGNSSFHRSFDSSFASDFVLPSLSDISDHVRRHACPAVGNALRFFPNQRSIVDAIDYSIPFFLIDGNTEKVDQKFSRWVSEKIGKCTDMTALERRSWEDARKSLESTAIETLGVIIGETSDTSIMREKMFFLLSLACHRPHFQFACFEALCQAAKLRGYSHVSDFLQESLEWLLLQWINEGRDLSSIPLLMCDPNLIETLLTLGIAGELTNSDNNLIERGPEQQGRVLRLAFDAGSLHRKALRKFAAMHASCLIPIILLSKPNFDSVYDRSECETDNHHKKYLAEVVTLLPGDDDIENFDEVVECHLHCVYALLYPMINAESCEPDCNLLRTRGNEATAYFHSRFPQGELKPRLARKLVLRLIQQCGRKPAVYGPIHDKALSNFSYMNAIKFVASELRQSRSSASVFEDAGTSVTECLLHVKSWIDNCAMPSRTQQLLSTMSIIFDAVTGQLSVSSAKNLQIGFCIHVLLSLISDQRLLNFRILILRTLRHFVHNLFKEDILKKVAPYLSQELNKIVVCLIQFHSESQRDFIVTCRKHQTEARLKTERSLGLLAKVKLGRHETSAGDLQPCIDSLTKPAQDLCEIMECVSDLLSFILLESPPFLEQALLSIYPLPFTEDGTPLDTMLSIKSRKFSICDLLSRFRERLSISALNLTSLQDEISRFVQFSEMSSKSTSNINRNSRFFEAALYRLWIILKQRRDGLLSNSVSSTMVIDHFQVLLSQLLALCTKDVSDSVRVAASRCLGELGDVNFSMFASTFSTKRDSVVSVVDDDDNYHPMTYFKSGALERLYHYMMSESTETSLVAMEAIRALFSTTIGDSYWALLTSDRTRVALNPLRHDTREKNMLLSTPEYFVKKMFCKSGGTCDKAIKQKDWCWSESIWKCEANSSLSYEEWIKDLVCSLIICCYDQSSSKTRQSGSIEESSVFFTLCIGMCAREHTFAEFLFPAIIFDLLSNGESVGSNRAENAALSVRDKVLADTMIGPSDGLVNINLTRCFSRILVGKQSACHRKAVSLAIDTMLFLLQVMKSRFLLSEKHKKNPVCLSNRVNLPIAGGRKSSASNQPLRDESNYNSDIDPPPIWKGLPYGIVLHLDGIDVAVASLEAKRFTSGLLFTDIFADNRLGGSGGVLERLSTQALGFQGDRRLGCATYGKFDISGYGDEFHAHDALLGTNCDERYILLLQDVLKQCLSELDERDAVLGVEAHATTLLFSGMPYNATKSDNYFDTGRINCLNDLLAVDSILQAHNSPSRSTLISPNNVLVTKALEALGLRHVMERYIAGLGQDIDPFYLNLENIGQSEKHELKEKMSQNSWRMRLWDDAIEVLNDPVAFNHVTRPIYSIAERDSELFRQNEADVCTIPGFHASVREALNCLSISDTATYKSRLSSARLALLHDIDAVLGSDSIFRVIGPVASKLQLLNDLELLPDEAKRDAFPPVLLTRWGLTEDSVTSTCSLDFSEEELVYSLREVAIRITSLKEATSEQPQSDLLILHLHRFCSLAREHGHVQSSQACLERLSKVVSMQNTLQGLAANQFSLPSMEVRLQEAKNLYAGRDFAGAIRTAKVVVSRLNQEKSTRIKIESIRTDRLLCDSLLQLGLWISCHYRIESAKSILENYFCPASQLADSLYARSQHPTDNEQAMQAHLSMAEFVAGIYESVVTRVKSREWELASVAAKHRQLELERSKEMYNEARERYTETASKTSSNAKARKVSPLSARKSTVGVQEAEDACHDLFLHLKVLEKEVEGDTKERCAVENSVSKFLMSAVESYEAGLSLNSASLAEPKDSLLKHVFRLVSLWFGNEGNSDVNVVFQRISKTVPTYLFVPLTYQIFSRLESTSSESTFQSALRSIVHNICVEHPYHSLVQLIALANGNKVGSGVGGRQSIAYLENVGESKVDACNVLLQAIRKCAPLYVAALVDSYSALIDSYIELAMAPSEQLIKDTKHRSKEISFSSIKSSSRSSIASLDRCLGSSKRRTYTCQPCVLTRPPFVRPGCDYGEGKEDPLGSERIDGFHPTFALTETGLHRPKIVICLGASGGKFKQLVKGEDDIRQDAIMQQVFSTVNRIFKAAAGRKPPGVELQIATYTVVPLSPASGVLEWVEDSLPLGNYLLDGKSIGAHSRYYPMEWSNSLCRSHFRDSPSNLKRETFDEVCKHFSPSLRFFFLEKFSYSTEAWHNAKMRYTRSCAVSSIVGHLLGIGDRHLLNILICEKTGNLVHIDFGIVFEQGKALTTPETVPFRLTRNIVDGMGPSGTEGTFSHAAEATMNLLRENASVLLTILSAVVSDPLYKWSVSPVNARLRQRSDVDDEAPVPKTDSVFLGDSSIQNMRISEDKNDAANRAISKIQQKLQGYENGTTGECHTVEGQVQLLINAARDHDNLCSLYFGWAPWV